ncbi:hypothetical protein GE061_011633 [Apolygus lucorum]|uniref:Lipid-binding serum glycoprotein N-terminal domain-containing protein n=1 Tax=Apolygus lucorum TaxID=248454 RepID=A0A6A4JYX9_APOLU|nr:hypothetical protein GE061_011633 [Apolygus lucorum]
MFPKFLSLCVLATIAVYCTEASPLQSFFPWSTGTTNKNLNWVLDTILKTVSSDLVVEHGDSLVIPNTQINTTQEVGILWWKFNTVASSTAPGTLKNISSVVRVSDAAISQTMVNGSPQIELKAELKLNDLAMEYTNVNTKLMLLSYDAGLTVKCPTNGFNVDILITSGSSCSAKLVAATITELGCNVELSEGGIMNYIKTHLFSYALGKVMDDVKSIMAAQLPSILTPIIEQHNVCKFLEPSS